MKHPIRLSGVALFTSVLALAASTIGTPAVIAPDRAVAKPANSFATGIVDTAFADPTNDRTLALDRSASVGAKYVLRVVSWADVAPAQPATPSDPADPAYDWGALDAFVVEAFTRELTPVISVSNAPAWAEGKGRPKTAPAGTWKPRPEAVRDFAAALAARFDGSFQTDNATLPRVRFFQAWTEPNLEAHLSPQWVGGKPKSPTLYARMLNAFYTGVKSVQNATVITAGTSPYGDGPGSDRVRPLAFWRSVLCVRKSHGRLHRAGCAAKARFDVLAHHAINTSGPPRQSALNPDDVSTPDLGSLARVLRFAERKRTTAGHGRHPLWVTEFWWESNPPDPRQGVSLRLQARYIQESLFLFWRAGAEAAFNFRASDSVQNEGTALFEAGTGLFLLSGEAKPAAHAFRFPFVVDEGSGRVLVWGRAPNGGEVVVERKSRRGWEPQQRLTARPDGVFVGNLSLEGPAKLRARAGSDRSLVWEHK